MSRVVVWVTLALVLAGCASDPPKPGAPQGLGEDVDVEATDTTGGIRGVVVDDAIRPLAGAHVVLVQEGLHANTTGEGTFSFSGLAPGTYFVEASRFGYASARQSVEVVAGDEHPPVARIQLLRDASQVAYYSAQSTTGFILCSTSLVLVCAAPQVVSDAVLCGFFHVCLGNVTPDRSGFYLYYEPNATHIQAELVWDSTQPLTPALEMSMENIDGCEADGDAYVEYAEGPSPLYNVADAGDIANGTIGGTCGIWYSFFSGGLAGVPVGVTVQQQVQLFSHEFHGYAPPAGWRFTTDGTVPPPPQ